MKLKPESNIQPNLTNTRAPSPAGSGSVLGRLDSHGPDFAREPFEDEPPVDVSYEKDPITLEEGATSVNPIEDVAIPARSAASTASSLFDPEAAKDLQTRWNEIQVAFVDEPRAAVERANNLVAETTQRLANSFASGRQKLENEWNQGGDVSTETLRLTLQHYRSFFNRLLVI
jgi:hypothetical protein